MRNFQFVKAQEALESSKAAMVLSEKSDSGSFYSESFSNNFQRKPMDASLLTERRVNTPYGLKGGKDGAKGNNLIHKSAIGTLMRLPPRCQLTLETNDMIELQTPGGGGYGDVNVKRNAESQPRRRSKRLKN